MVVPPAVVPEVPAVGAVAVTIDDRTLDHDVTSSVTLDRNPPIAVVKTVAEIRPQVDMSDVRIGNVRSDRESGRADSDRESTVRTAEGSLKRHLGVRARRNGKQQCPGGDSGQYPFRSLSHGLPPPRILPRSPSFIATAMPIHSTENKRVRYVKVSSEGGRLGAGKDGPAELESATR